MSAAMCWRAAKVQNDETNMAADKIWAASHRARLRAGDEQPVAIERAYRIELLYRALVVVMARRGG